MRIAVLTGSVSRLAGGTFTSIKRPMHEMIAAFPVKVGVFGLKDSFTPDDLPGWSPLVPETFPTIGPKAFGYAPGYFDAVDRYLPDIMQIHGIWMHFSQVSLSINKKHGIPYVVNPHGMLDPWAVNNSPWKKRLAGFFYENEHLRSAACLRALCESEAFSMRRYGLNNPICQIPNGVDLPEAPVSIPAPWRDAIEPGKKVLLFLSRIHEKKGLRNLIAAWAQARKEEVNSVSDWVLAIAGWDTTGHQEELLKLVDDLQVHDSIRFIGPQFDGQKDSAYFHADAFVLPSYSEGLPMTVLEAWAFDLPVVMTPECNLPEGFSAEAAIRVETNSASIRDGLQVLFQMTDAERRSMGERGKRLVEERYTWDTIARQMYQVNTWILGGGTPPECLVK